MSMNISLIKEPTSASSTMLFSSAYISHTLKAINCFMSAGFFIGLWVALGPTWKGVEFVQILFLSLLLVLVTVPLQNRWWRGTLALIVVVIMVLWLYFLAVLWVRQLNLGVVFTVSVFVCGMLWSLGILAACYLSERQNSNGEVDLIIYLLTLNVVSAWSPANTFNNELHLLLDVRTFMLVYNCLHKLQKNEELLRYPSFISVVVLTIITFILSQALFANYMGNATEGVSIAVFLIFGIVGALLLVEVYYRDKGAGSTGIGNSEPQPSIDPKLDSL